MAVNTDASVAFAKNVVNMTIKDLNQTQIEMIKTDVLDTLACLLGGSTADAGKEVVELANEFGGKPESTIMAYGGKVPAPMAAFCNATMAHALDLDDTDHYMPVHIGPIVVSASLAAAEMVGGVSGEKLIEAVALGCDMMVRMAQASTYPIHKYGFMFTPLYGYFAATAAVGHIMGLNEEQMVNAFGIAYAQCAGNVQVNIDDEHALTKRLSCGFAARGGIMSCLLAKKGLTGAQHSLEGRFGLFNIYQRGDYSHDKLVENIGKDYQVELSFKPWACCRQIHSYIDAALQIKREHDFNTDDIEKITIFTNELAGKALCDPLPLRQNPEEEVHAQFSIPWNVGQAFAYNKVGINSIHKEFLGDEKVKAITAKTEYVLDPVLAEQKLLAPDKALEVTLKDGTKFTSHGTTTPLGDPDNPMTLEQQAQKVKDCAENAPKKLDDAKIAKLIEICGKLETVADVSELPALIA